MPTQETLPAGKGSLEETGKLEGPAVEETRQITEVEKVYEDFADRGTTNHEVEKVYEDFTEGKTVEESTSFEVETESCTDEALPAQEIMARVKGLFRRLGLKWASRGGKLLHCL